jgi:outer membrane lipoprotein SlyB
MSIALVRLAFLCTLLSVSSSALADERGAAAGAITGGVAGALVGGPIGAIIGAGIGGVAGGAVSSPAAVQVERPSSVVRERVLIRRPVTEEPEVTGSVVQTTCVEDARGYRTCRSRRAR